MLRKILSVSIVLTLALAAAAPAAALGQEESTLQSFFRSFLEWLTPPTPGEPPQKNDAGPGVDPNNTGSLVVPPNPSFQNESDTTDLDLEDKGSSVDPDGRD